MLRLNLPKMKCLSHKLNVKSTIALVKCNLEEKTSLNMNSNSKLNSHKLNVKLIKRQIAIRSIPKSVNTK